MKVFFMILKARVGMWCLPPAPRWLAFTIFMRPAGGGGIHCNTLWVGGHLVRVDRLCMSILIISITYLIFFFFRLAIVDWRCSEWRTACPRIYSVSTRAKHTYSSFKYHKKHFHFIQMHFIILAARVGMFSPIPTASTTGGGTSQVNSQFFVRQVFWKTYS